MATLKITSFMKSKSLLSVVPFRIFKSFVRPIAYSTYICTAAMDLVFIISGGSIYHRLLKMAECLIGHHG